MRVNRVQPVQSLKTIVPLSLFLSLSLSLSLYNYNTTFYFQPYLAGFTEVLSVDVSDVKDLQKSCQGCDI